MGIVTGVSVISHDITDQQTGRGALRETEEGWPPLSESLTLARGTGMFKTDAIMVGGNPLHLSTSLASARANTVRRSFCELIHPDDRQKMENALSDALQGARDYDIEYRIKLANGTKKWSMPRAKCCAMRRAILFA